MSGPPRQAVARWYNLGMAAYLTIPDVTDSEELVSFSHHDTHAFEVTVHAGPTGMWLFHAATQGTYVPLMVVTMEGSGMIALDDVVVASGQMSGAPESDLMTFGLNASVVRMV